MVFILWLHQIIALKIIPSSLVTTFLALQSGYYSTDTFITILRLSPISYTMSHDPRLDSQIFP